jgi:2-polyprenyl-6-methoxyphenol hydroxylase-like FAD-dependent oxidoreductase
LKLGVPGNYLNVRRPDGHLIVRQQIRPMGGPSYPGTTGISRKSLHELLLGAALREGTALRQGTSIRSFEPHPDSVEVVFDDGSGTRYDLMVGTDGLYSRTRSALFPDVLPIFDGQAVWRAGIPRPLGNFATELHVGGPLGLVGLCPISEDKAYLYIVEGADRGTRHEGEGATTLMLNKLSDYSSPLVRAAARHLPESKTVTFRPLESILLPAPWYKGRVLLMGDAAHAGPPVLAQGAAMGMEDGVVFGQIAQSHAAVDDMLARFVERRFPRAEYVVRNSRQLCEWEVTHRGTPELVGKTMREAQQFLSQPF